MGRLTSVKPRLVRLSPSRLRAPNECVRGWQGASPNRIRGSKWMKIRAMVLAEEPICRSCIRVGAITKDSISTICDHIVPLSEGGREVRSNWQGMCGTCHDRKTAAESARAQGRTPRHRGGGSISG